MEEQEQEQKFYAVTYDNGTGYKEFSDVVVSSIEEAQQQVTDPAVEVIEEVTFDVNNQMWVSVTGFFVED